MLTSLALIFLVGLAMAAICQKLKLPRIIGMLLTGILLGPYALNWLDESILGISSQLRQIALIIMVKGMAGIFAVTLVILLLVWLLGKIGTRNSSEDPKQ